MGSPKIRNIRHVLAVNDLVISTEYFLSKLGFERDFSGGGWEFLSFGDFQVMLGECPNEVPASKTNNHSYFPHFLVDDADAALLSQCNRHIALGDRVHRAADDRNVQRNVTRQERIDCDIGRQDFTICRFKQDVIKCDSTSNNAFLHWACPFS